MYLKVTKRLKSPAGALMASCLVAAANSDPSKIILRATGVRRNLDKNPN